MPKFLIHIKREFWECRTSFVRTPFAMAGILMVLLLLGMAPFQSTIGSFLEHSRIEYHGKVQKGSQFLESLEFDGVSAAPEYLVQGLAGVYSLFVLVLLLVLAFYFADALYSDRRDRSILFWKSLPVSEHTAVLAKLAAGAVGAPAFYVAAALSTGAFYLLAILVYAKFFWSLPVPGIGAVVAAFLSSTVGLILGWLLLVLWLLPLFCWLLFCSAAARKAPFLLALGIPLGLMLFEAWAFGTGHLLGVLRDQITTGLYHLQSLAHHTESIGAGVAGTFSSVQFWIGLAVSAGLLSACVWLRHSRWEI